MAMASFHYNNSALAATSLVAVFATQPAANKSFYYNSTSMNGFSNGQSIYLGIFRAIRV